MNFYITSNGLIFQPSPIVPILIHDCDVVSFFIVQEIILVI